MDKSFYISTPIYYPSAKPHMGHAYSSIIADFFARFKRIDGFQVFFLTGTDEHGLKIQRAAENKGIRTLDFCNEISKTFKELSKTLNLTNTDFIRTTEERHKKSVQHLWKELIKNDNIYLLDSSDYNIIPYFLIADVLISDLSSTIFEFLPLNRPIIQVECLKLRLRHRIFNRRFKKKLDLERMQELDFVYKVDYPSELHRNIAFATDHPEEMSDLRQVAHDYYLYKNDGKLSHRLVNEIEKKLS